MTLEHLNHPHSKERLDETINDIHEALGAPDFNEEDREAVRESLAYFEARRDRFMAAAGQTIKSAELAA
ncbi:hypothetical protein BGO17_03935 [Candidatus Saccharibacteria bacterium 49-20]|nr:MAG: hypothetical protein BGO17_03935 [Candidatus Saccharibacteria bacterium 49-20]